jgi:hypothetical protein
MACNNIQFYGKISFFQWRDRWIRYLWHVWYDDRLQSGRRLDVLFYIQIYHNVVTVFALSGCAVFDCLGRIPLREETHFWEGEIGESRCLAAKPLDLSIADLYSIIPLCGII